ncbi:MAG: type II secretion system protein GspD [Candidatus Eremiobacteraeota bacterium]|nr:type II secretion system protein GspD [Candidatus Eremiobacteraeota bacterium]
MMLRHTAIAALVAVLLGAMLAPALAAVALNAVAVALQPNGGARVTVQFSGPPPRYTLTGAGTSETSVIFQQATMGPGVPPTIAGSGPVKSISVAQVGANVAVSLHLAANGPVRVQPGGNFVIIDVPTLSPQRVPTQGLEQSPAPSPSGVGEVTEVIPLKYADVSEVAGVLVQGANVPSNDNFSPQTSNFGAQSFGGALNGQTQPFQQPTFQQNNFGNSFGGGSQGLAQKVSDNLAIDRRLNAVILTGPPDVVAAMRDVIEKIDIPLDSVLLETQIVELDENGAKDLGIDFNGGQGNAGTATYTSQSLMTAQAKAQFNATLFALETRGESRILAKPRIIAQNGAAASILTGDALPIITTVIVAGTSAISSQQVNYVNVGVNLQILPRVSSDGYVTSHIFAEVSSVTGFTQGIPEISQRQAVTQATVKDGDSFVIGGLLQDNEIRTVYKVPGIGDIPLIGALFRRLSTTKQRTNLYVVVTPHIIQRKPAGSAGALRTPVRTPNAVGLHLPRR